MKNLHTFKKPEVLGTLLPEFLKYNCRHKFRTDKSHGHEIV